MSAPWRDWLPAEAMIDEIAIRAHDALIAAWAADWFVRAEDRPLRSGRMELAAVREPRGSCGVAEGAVTVHAEHKAAAALADAALGSSRLKRADNDRDRTLLATFQHSMLTDLARRFATELHPGPLLAPESSQVLRMTVAGAGMRRVLAISFPASHAARHRKVIAGTGSRGGAELHRRAAAIETMRVEIEMLLGRAALSLNELRELGPGDVVMLDRKSEEGAIFEIGNGTRIASGRIVDDGGYLRLAIQD